MSVADGPAAVTENARPKLRSEKYVTSGYQNVLARTYLYGLGLTGQDMRLPFAGLAVAHNEALSGEAAVRTLGNRAKRRLPVAGLMPREFVVPESVSNAATDIRSRELVADSAELVVRGHWYDALIGVVGSVPAAFGLAQCLVRLRLPGLVLVPAELVAHNPALREATDALAALDLALVVESAAVLDDAFAEIEARVQAERSSPATLNSLVERFPVALAPAALTGGVFAHVCALAHELGLADASDLVGPRLAVVELRIESGVSADVGLALAAAELPMGTWTGHLDPDGRVRLRQDRASRAAVVFRRDDHGPISETADEWVLLADRASDVLVGRVVIGETETRCEAGIFPTALLGGCDHPGRVDSTLNYDRL